MNDDLIIVDCKCVSELMKNSRGDTCHFPLPIARKLEAEGHIKIVSDNQGEPVDKNIVQAMSDIDYLFRKAFDKSQRLTRVAWVQDYHKDGGAELSSQVVVQVGNRCGFDIVGVTPDNFNMSVVNDSDIVILGNCFEFANDQFNQMLDVFFHGKKYIKYEHDHREINLRKGIGKRLFENSKLNVFISPQHRKNHEEAFGDCIKEKSITLPLAIRTARFNAIAGIHREENSYFVPSYRKCKENIDAFIKEHPEYKFTTAGEFDRCDLPGVRNLGPVLIADMCRIYSEHKYMLHLPLKVGAGERVVFESVLCGCEPITNENASHISWAEQWDYRDQKILRSRLDAAPNDFWRAVSKVVKEK